MAVTQARLDSFRAEVDACGDAAATYVEDLVGAIVAEHPDAGVAEIRDAAVDAVDDALYAFGDQASELALDLFEEIVSERAIEVEPAIYDTVADDMVEGGVRYLARKLVEGKVEEFARDVADLTRYYVKRSSFENMVENCWRNDVRWARVPTGLETCGFCFMLSSRGFAYGSERTASQKKEGGAYHENCDCIAVPGFEGMDWDTQIEGYEPNRMRERWAECAEAVGADPGTNDKEELARIRAEVETRDWRWLYEGDVPKVDYSSNPISSYGRLLEPDDYSPENIVDRGNEWRDLWAHHVLSENGFAVKAFDSKSLDIAIGDVWWDIKSPEPKGAIPKKGRELSFIENDVRKAIRQFDKRGLYGKTRIVYNPKYRHVASDEDMMAELLRQMRGHGVEEALFITEEGGVVRLRT